MARIPVVKATNLTKEFHLGAVDVTALDGVNLEIYSGEFVVFYGPSGCGKSTLMSMVAGLQPPSKGKVLIRGEDLSKMDSDQLAKHRRTKIGMVFQSFNLIGSMNIVENIALPLSFDRIPRKRRMARAINLLETVGMAEYKHHTPGELSGGQQQRIALARSLVSNPWIILADEPTGNLDSKSSDDVMRLLIKLNRKSKRTVILISHNPDYLVYADRIFHLKDGKVINVEVNTNVKTDIVKQPPVPKSSLSVGAKVEKPKTEKSKEDPVVDAGVEGKTVVGGGSASESSEMAEPVESKANNSLVETSNHVEATQNGRDDFEVSKKKTSKEKTNKDKVTSSKKKSTRSSIKKAKMNVMRLGK